MALTVLFGLSILATGAIAASLAFAYLYRYIDYRRGVKANSMNGQWESYLANRGRRNVGILI